MSTKPTPTIPTKRPQRVSTSAVEIVAGQDFPFPGGLDGAAITLPNGDPLVIRAGELPTGLTGVVATVKVEKPSFAYQHERQRFVFFPIPGAADLSGVGEGVNESISRSFKAGAKARLRTLGTTASDVHVPPNIAALIAGVQKISVDMSEIIRQFDLTPNTHIPVITQRRSVDQSLLDSTPIKRENPRITILRQRAVEAVFSGSAWLSAVDVGSRVDPDAVNKHALANRWLNEGRVFAVRRLVQNEFPSYAFEETGQPIPALRNVLSILDGMSPFRIAAWFESTSSTLGGKRPRELLATDSLAVITAAQAHRSGPLHG